MSSIQTEIEQQDEQVMTILDLEVFRAHDGIHIKAKSKPFEDFFKNGHIGSMIRIDQSSWGTVTEVYRLNSMLEQTDFYYAFNYLGPNYNLRISDYNLPNLAFLRAKGLSEGIEVVQRVALTEKNIEQFCNEILQKADSIFRSLIKPRNHRIKITCQLS